MEIPCKFYENPMETPWEFHGTLHGNSKEILQKFNKILIQWVMGIVSILANAILITYILMFQRL